MKKSLRIVIWKCTSKEIKESFYVLEGTNDTCAILEKGRVNLDEDLSGFGFYGRQYHPSSDFNVTKIIDHPLEFHSTPSEREAFCMINNLDMEICKLLEFAFKNKEDLFYED